MSVQMLMQHCRCNHVPSLCRIWVYHGGDWRMPSSGILRRVALVRTDVSEERIASIIRVTRIGELRTKSAVNSNWRMLRFKKWFQVIEYMEFCPHAFTTMWLMLITMLLLLSHVSERYYYVWHTVATDVNIFHFPSKRNPSKTLHEYMIALFHNKQDERNEIKHNETSLIGTSRQFVQLISSEHFLSTITLTLHKVYIFVTMVY
jgi:hypothetical protein